MLLLHSLHVSDVKSYMVVDLCCPCHSFHGIMCKN